MYSFVMPIFKAKYLKKAIESILTQTYHNWELILVNDASPDRIEDIVNQYDDVRIIYHVNKQNIGGKNLISHWNHCISYAKGKYLILASDDDVYDLTFLACINRCVNLYPLENLLRTRVQRIDAEGNITDFEHLYKEQMSQAEFVFYWSKGFISCISNYVFKREALMKQGGFIDFPCAWYSDDASIIRMAEKGVVNTKEILFSFRSSNLSISWTFNINVLKKKWKATDDFYYWFEKEFSHLNCDDAFLSVYQNNAIFNVRNKVKIMFSQLIKNVPLREFSYVIKSLNKNQILYTKEKIHLLIDFFIK